MIRALIGRFVHQHKRRQLRGEWRKVDLAEMTDAEVSDWIHGRPIDWDAVDRRRATVAAGPWRPLPSAVSRR